MSDVLKFGQNGKNKSKFSEWLHYLTTSRGRFFSYKVMGAVSIGIPTFFASYQTFFIDYYLNFVRAYRNGLPLEVPEELESLVDKASDRVKLTVVEATYLKAFMISGFDIRTYGSVHSRYSGWIGLPLNYMYSTSQDIDRMNLKLRTEQIDWNSKYGELLEKSLVLTEDEKLFGILRSVLELRNYNHIHTTLVPGATIFALYSSARAINDRYNLFQIPRSGRMLVYTVLSFFAYGIYSFITDTIRISQVSSIDKALVELGTDVIESGIRFYEKLLRKNIAIRELSGKDLYSVKGNEYPGLLRFNVFPLTTRKLFLQTALQETKKKETEDAKTDCEDNISS
ncbi:uncharacterized protein LOC129571383 [Sitodiplosis mosellana]|uniref:uncharacterized protein LOC129571383 n=1 Tax=Sitodiplosis mosellana TaxID=263140 RepID=UPI00244484CA|nr:uncharacterized protein LOC129571383 [Sitodiplosis mosellana]